MENMDFFGENTKAKLNKSELVKVFTVLDTKLKENSLVLQLAIYGGSVMNLLYDNRPATRDIDCVFNTSDEKLLDNILDDVGFIFSLNKNWINQDIKEPLKALERQELLKLMEFDNLKIIAPSKEQMLAMKVLSARPEPSKDFIDAELLCKDLNITTKEQIIKNFRRFMPVSLIGERQIQFIKYVGVDLGYDWK